MPINLAFISNPRISLSSAEGVYLLRRLVEYLGIREDIDLLCIAGELLAPVEEPEPALTAIKAFLDMAPFPTLMAPALDTNGADLCRKMFINDTPGKLNDFHLQVCDLQPEQTLSAESMKAALSCDGTAATPAAKKRIVILPSGCQLPAQSSDFSPEFLCVQRVALVAAAQSPTLAGQPKFPGLAVLDDFAMTPYPFTLFSLADGGQAPGRQDLAVRLPLPLRDLHTHTHFAYCNDDMNLTRESRLMDAINISGTAITEHSGHLVFSRQEYWGRHWYPGNLTPSPQNDRVAAYCDFLAQASAQDPRFLPGLEVDIDLTGHIVIDQELIKATRIRLGAVHLLSMSKPTPDTPGAVDEFMFLTERLITSGLIQVLAHPFRVFAWDGEGDKPEWVFDKIVRLLKRHQVAAEINFHHNRPDPVFTRKCLDAGVKLSLGSDTHSLYELGAFLPHLDFLRQIGYNGDWRDILINAEP